MKTRLIPILTAALAAGTTFTAFADLPQLDSAQFAYKYEMVERPDQQDLDGGGANDFTGWGAAFSLGIGKDVGSIKIDASSNGKYLVSNQDVGTAGDGWRSMAASSTTGFTVEARVKVTACTGANGAICIEAGPSDSKVYARLNLFGNKIGWNGTDLKEMNTSEWHTYRITREGGKAVHSVYVDGELVAENLGTGFTYNNSTLYRMLLGSPGSGWTGKAEVAWLRFHKGAYAPLTPDDKSRRKSSSDFLVQYEMNSNDGCFATDGNAKQSGTEWTASVGTAPTVSLNNWLSMNPNGKNTAYWVTKDAVWKSIVTPSTPYTVEFRTKIKDCNIAGIDRSLNFLIGTSGPVASLFVGTHTVEWQVDDSMGHNIILDATSNNTDAWHTFRITYSGGGRHAFTVWRDGVKIGEDLVDCTNFYSNNTLSVVRFGVVSTKTHGGEFDIDYIRWDTTGAYDWKDPRKGLQIKIR